jgi:hypothetical protein
MFKYLNSIKFSLYFGLSFLFATCKNEVTLNKTSETTVKYFTCGSKDKVNTIEKTTDGGFIYCGYTNADSARTDAFLLKVDGRGNKEWYKTYNGEYFDEFRHVIQTSDGGYIAVGQTNSLGFGLKDGTFRISDFVVKINSGGLEEWRRSFLIYQSCLTNVIETRDHNFLITGYIYPTNYSSILMKVDGSGNLLMAKSYSSLSSIPPLFITNNYDEYGQNVSLTNDGSILIAGVMSKSLLTTEAQSHVTFLMKLNQSGTPIFYSPIYDFVRGRWYLQGFGDIQKRLATVKIINLDEGYLIGTYLEDPITTVIKIQLIKTDFEGKIQWHKEYPGLGNALLYNLSENTDGSIMVLGASGKMPLSWQFAELFYNLETMLLKVDKDGNEIWTRYIGGDRNVNYSKCIQQLPNGGWNIAGYTTFNESSYDIMNWMEVDKDGKLIVNK